MPKSLHDIVQRLYNENHGTHFTRITPVVMSEQEEVRRTQWRELWTELGFHTEHPTGSSRLFEMIVAQSTANPLGPLEMIEELFELLGHTRVKRTQSFDYFVHNLAVNCWVNRPLFDQAFKLPSKVLPRSDMTRAQAWLLYRFAMTTDDDTANYIESLCGLDVGADDD